MDNLPKDYPFIHNSNVIDYRMSQGTWPINKHNRIIFFLSDLQIKQEHS